MPEEPRSLLLRQGGTGEAVSATRLKTKGVVSTPKSFNPEASSYRWEVVT